MTCKTSKINELLKTVGGIPASVEQMNLDYHFCLDYVNKMMKLGGTKTKTRMDLFRVVIDKTPMDVNKMWNDTALKELYKADPVGKFIYTFVRDNQELFI